MLNKSVFALALALAFVVQPSFATEESCHEGDHQCFLQKDDPRDNSGSCLIQGQIPIKVSLAVECNADECKSLNIEGGETDKNVMNVTEKSNYTGGYKVTLTSANGGKLKSGAVVIPYTAKYNGVAVASLAAPSIVTTVPSQVSVINVTKGLNITFAGSSNLAGIYSDTLTFTIAAN